MFWLGAGVGLIVGANLGVIFMALFKFIGKLGVQKVNIAQGGLA